MSVRMFSHIALVGLLAAATLACQSDPEKVAGFISVGDEYVEAGQDREAVIEYRNVLKIDPNHGGAHYGLAQAYLRLGRLKDGYWELRETVRLAPENLEARQRFGEVSAMARDFEEANTQADYLLAANIDSANAQHLKGAALEGLGNAEDAEGHYRRAIELSPDKAELVLDLARHHTRREQTEKAEVALKQYVEIEKGWRSAVQLARFYVSTERLDEAEAAARMGIERNEDESAAPYLALATFKRQQGLIDEAIEILEQGIEGSKRDTVIFYELARIHASRGDSERADALIIQATEADPEDPQGFLVLSQYRSGLGDREGALEAVERALDVGPDDHRAILRKAELLTERGYREKDYATLQEARKLTDRILEEQASNADALFVHAKIEMAEGAPDAAVLSLRSAINTRPGWSEAHFLLGSALALQGDRPGARIELARSLELGAKNPEARRLLTAIHVELGEHEYAIEQGRAYLATKPDAIPVRIQVAQSLVNLGKVKQAFEELQLIDEEARTVDVHYALGRLFMVRGELEEARGELHLANEMMPNRPEVLRSMLRLDQVTGNLAESIARLETSLEADPANPNLVQILGEALLLNGDKERAEQMLIRATQLAPDDPGVFRRLAGYYQLAGDTPKTIEALEAASAIRPDLASVHHSLGVLYESTGQPEKAMERYESAILHGEDMGESKNNLAYLLVERGGSLDRALELAQEAKALLPDNPNAADTLGWVLHKRGVSSAAVGYLEEAEAGMPEGSSGWEFVQYHLALAYESTGNTDRAGEKLGAALSGLSQRRERAKAAGKSVADPEWEAAALEMQKRLPANPKS